MHPQNSVANSTTLIVQLTTKSGERIYSANMSALLAFGDKFAHRIKSAMEAFSKTRAYPTISYAHQIQRWGLSIKDNKVNINDYDLTNPDDLDELHLIYLDWFFTKNPAIQKANLETIKRYWTNQGDFIKFCQNTKVLPVWEWFVFPKMRNAPPKSQYVDSDINFVIHPPKKYEAFYTKIAASKTLSLTTHDAISELKQQLIKNIERLEKSALKKIDQIISDFEIGTLLAEKADVDILEKLSPGDPPDRFTIGGGRKYRNRSASISKNGSKIKASSYWRSQSLHIFSPAYDKGINNLVWWVRKHYNGYIPQDFASRNAKSPCDELNILRHYPSELLQKHLGVITHRKLVPFILLLFCKCREISNLDPLLRLSVSDITPTNNGLYRISVDKRRANSIKWAVLDAETRKRIEFLEDRTHSYREEYIKCHAQPCDALFIGLKSDTYAGTPRTLKDSSSTGKLLKQLLKAEGELADLQDVTFSSIRNTHAVIAYIDSNGDWHQVARNIGHSVQTSMRHYIPPELTALLRERKARQHQNEMLIVASYGQPFDLVDAVDFRTKEEVEAFLINVLRIDTSRTDVLLSELDRKIKLTQSSSRSEVAEPGPREIAHIALSVEGLAALFKYENQMADIDQSLDASLSDEQTTANFWRQLSFSLRILLSSESYPNTEHVVIYKRALVIASSPQI